MNSKTQIFFLKRLSFMLSSGHSLHQSLMLSMAGENLKLQAKIKPIITAISEGKPFAESLRQSKVIDDNFSIQIIALGERTGSLANSVELASSELSSKRTLYNKILGSLLYPMCVVSGTLLISLSLVFLIFPKVLPVFSGLGVKLPLSTRILMWSIGICVKHWFLVCLGLLIFIFVSAYLLRKHNWRIPLVKNLWLARSLQIIGLTTKVGMPIDQSILFCAETLSEPHYKKALNNFVGRIKEGEKVGKVFSGESKLFPALVSSFIEVAERSGSLSEAFLYLSAFYHGEIETMTKRLTELIEPALMIVLGLCIGFIGVSLIAPIYGITNHVTH